MAFYHCRVVLSNLPPFFSRTDLNKYFIKLAKLKESHLLFVSSLSIPFFLSVEVRRDKGQRDCREGGHEDNVAGTGQGTETRCTQQGPPFLFKLTKLTARGVELHKLRAVTPVMGPLQTA